MRKCLFECWMLTKHETVVRRPFYVLGSVYTLYKKEKCQRARRM